MAAPPARMAAQEKISLLRWAVFPIAQPVVSPVSVEAIGAAQSTGYMYLT